MLPIGPYIALLIALASNTLAYLSTPAYYDGQQEVATLVTHPGAYHLHRSAYLDIANWDLRCSQSLQSIRSNQVEHCVGQCFVL